MSGDRRSPPGRMARLRRCGTRLLRRRAPSRRAFGARVRPGRRSSPSGFRLPKHVGRRTATGSRTSGERAGRDRRPRHDRRDRQRHFDRELTIRTASLSRDEPGWTEPSTLPGLDRRRTISWSCSWPPTATVSPSGARAAPNASRAACGLRSPAFRSSGTRLRPSAREGGRQSSGSPTEAFRRRSWSAARVSRSWLRSRPTPRHLAQKVRSAGDRCQDGQVMDLHLGAQQRVRLVALTRNPIAGSRVRLRISTTAPVKRATVSLQRRAGHRWVRLARGQLRGRSLVLAFKPRIAGKVRLRAALTTVGRPYISPVIVLTVRPARLTKQAVGRPRRGAAPTHW